MALDTRCPSCGSELVQPLRTRSAGDAAMLVELRCPECFTQRETTMTAADVRALDEAQSDGRRRLLDAYERSVSESMEALAFCLGRALDLDLLGADDFAPRRAA